MYSPTRAECQLVPQAVRTIRSIIRSCCGVRFRPPKTAVASSRFSRPRMAAVDCLGLLENFLEHVVRIAAELDLRRVDIEHLHVVPHVAFIAMDDSDRLGGDHGDFIVGQVDDAIGVPDERRAVAGDEMFAVADADHERAAQPGGDDHVRPIAENHRQAVRAAELGECRLNGSDERRILVGRRRGFNRRGPGI